jgi:hypothetical protein
MTGQAERLVRRIASGSRRRARQLLHVLRTLVSPAAPGLQLSSNRMGFWCRPTRLRLIGQSRRQSLCSLFRRSRRHPWIGIGPVVYHLAECAVAAHRFATAWDVAAHSVAATKQEERRGERPSHVHHFMLAMPVMPLPAISPPPSGAPFRADAGGRRSRRGRLSKDLAGCEASDWPHRDRVREIHHRSTISRTAPDRKRCIIIAPI